jgi:hypothetical protein
MQGFGREVRREPLEFLPGADVERHPAFEAM